MSLVGYALAAGALVVVLSVCPFLAAYRLVDLLGVADPAASACPVHHAATVTAPPPDGMRAVPADVLRATVALTVEKVSAPSDVELDNESLADAVHATAVDRVTPLVEAGEVAYGGWSSSPRSRRRPPGGRPSRISYRALRFIAASSCLQGARQSSTESNASSRTSSAMVRASHASSVSPGYFRRK